MRTTSFLFTIAGLVLAAGCHNSPPPEKPARSRPTPKSRVSAM